MGFNNLKHQGRTCKVKMGSKQLSEYEIDNTVLKTYMYIYTEDESKKVMYVENESKKLSICRKSKQKMYQHIQKVDSKGIQKVNCWIYGNSQSKIHRTQAKFIKEI